jgi:thiamine-phosphate pyrophosphorylase
LLPWKIRLEQAKEIKKVTDEYQIPLIINDDIDICLQLDTFGIHLGKDDESIKNARSALGANKCIGMSCYNRVDRVEMAIRNKADYIALGACFETKTKPTAPIVSLEMIRRVRQKYDIPTVAIGGITIDNIGSLKETGIQCFALINSIFSSTNIISTIKQFKSKI